jgi:hypothetical protein
MTRGKDFPQILSVPERRFTAAPLFSLWSAKKKEGKERKRGGLGSRALQNRNSDLNSNYSNLV